MIKPSFIPPADIRQLRDLVRYRTKLTNILTGEKNRALNCLTVSNLKLDDVFSDVFDKSSRSIINYILEHPGQSFDVSPFVDRRCKKSIEEIQAANTVIRSDKHPEFKERYRRLKARRGHKKAIIAICRMLLTAIWNILSKLEPYSPNGYLRDKLTEHSVVISKAEGLALLRKRGYIFKDEVVSSSP